MICNYNKILQPDKYLVILMEDNIMRGYDYIYFLDSS